MTTWKETIGLAMLVTPGYAAALAAIAEHHRGAWATALVAGLTFVGFFLVTTGGRK